MLDRLLAMASRPERVVVGLISGTSADSIDVALCRIHGDGPVELLGYGERPYDPATRRRVLDVASLTVRDLAELHVEIGTHFASACLDVLKECRFPVEEVHLIGSHGQTLYHHSSVPGAMRATLQVGDGDVIAQLTGLPVISDFRARDVAAGGEGAPLTPRSDMVLFGGDSTGRAVLNLGGIANVTVLSPDPGQVFGFDTGPANTLIDRLARRLSGGTLDCDRDGLLARSGRPNEALVASLLEEDAYLLRQPPKSTGYEMYGDAFVERAGRFTGPSTPTSWRA